MSSPGYGVMQEGAWSRNTENDQPQIPSALGRGGPESIPEGEQEQPSDGRQNRPDDQP